VIEGIGDHHPQARKQVRQFLGPQFTALKIQDDVPEVGDVGLAPVRSRRAVRIEYRRAEQKASSMQIPPCPTVRLPSLIKARNGGFIKA
jgi:hypothetical protein